MKRKFYLNIFLTLIFAGLLSCGSKNDDIDDGPCSVAWSVAIQDEVSAWSAAAQKYALDQSVANCNAYKAAGLAYVNALEPYNNCAVLTGTNRTQWEQALDNARTSINSLNCN
jgi:hypothetical protein